MKIVRYSNTENKEQFISLFSKAPRELRCVEYHTGLLPDELWVLFFQYPYPKPIDFWIVTNDNGEVVGRIGASISAGYKNTCFVGFFEASSINVSRLLFKEVDTFAKENNVKDLVGPMNINTWFQYRLSVVDISNDDENFSWEPVNPPIYNDFFKDAGYKVDQTYTTCGIEGLTYKLDRYEKAYEKATSFGYKIRHLDFENDLENEIKRIYEISMEGFKDNLYFEPIPLELFQKLYVPAVQSYNFKYSTICESSDGEPVAFFFVFDQGDYMVLKSVATKIAHRQKGISNAMSLISLKEAQKSGLKNTITALVKDSAVSETFAEGGNYLWTHKYNLYKKVI